MNWPVSPCIALKRVVEHGAARDRASKVTALLALVALGATTGLVQLASADVVELRSGDLVEGRITAMDRGGVTVRRAVIAPGAGPARPPAAGQGSSLESSERLGWDRVARVAVDGATPVELPAWLAEGERLWRARLRLVRGDARLAAEALGPAWTLDAPEGPTGAIAALVDLHLALAADDRPRAWRAWLDASRLRRAGFRDAALETWVEPGPTGMLERRALVDDATGLCPVLPPFPTDDAERSRLLEVLRAVRVGEDGELASWRDMIMSIVDPSIAPPPAPAPPRGGARSAEGVSEEARRMDEFLRALRAARSADPAERARARDVLASLRRRMPEWTEAWARFAAGSGLLLDGTPEATLAAQLELMHLPARFAEVQPHLARRALLLSADASERLGESQEAVELRRRARSILPETP
ncbi:MAG: hypothetical protein KF724_07920 [Phycisphaeraceae bacterium]|nr:hypothetical protein [Phycisphaeraceae bacterium]